MRSTGLLVHVISIAASSCSSAFTIVRPTGNFVQEPFAIRGSTVAFETRKLEHSIEVGNLSKLTVLELKDKLKQLNLATDGRKHVLIDRLNDYYLSLNSIEHNEEGDGNNLEVDAPVFINSSNEFVEDLNTFTIPMLKERLKGLGLPVGGRKAELLERLQSVSSETGQILIEERNETDDIPSVIDTGCSSIIGIAGRIADNEGESSAAQRARRKKFWKTQEVRQLIKSNDPSASEKAEEMVSSLEELAKQEVDDNFLPGPIQYTLLIDAYAKSGADDAIQRAEAVIDRLLSRSTGKDISPTAQMMNAIMSAYANIGDVASAAKATAILERMEYLKEFGQRVKPTVHSYSIAISAWAKCGSCAAAENAESILNRLFEEYDRALSSGDSSHYAEECRPNNVVFNSVIDAW